MNLTWHLMVSRVNQVLATLPQKLEIVKSTLSANQTRASLLHSGKERVKSVGRSFLRF